MSLFITKLNQKNVLKMTQEQRLLKMEQLQDKICNLDYIESPELSDILNYNLSLIESKAVFNEY